MSHLGTVQDSNIPAIERPIYLYMEPFTDAEIDQVAKALAIPQPTPAQCLHILVDSYEYARTHGAPDVVIATLDVISTVAAELKAEVES